MAYSPGPWRWDGKFTVTIPTPDGDWSFRTSPPDARLIAAAPELLAALNGMVGLIQLIQSREPELLANHRFIEAQRVIAKAEGR